MRRGRRAPARASRPPSGTSGLPPRLPRYGQLTRRCGREPPPRPAPGSSAVGSRCGRGCAALRRFRCGAKAPCGGAGSTRRASRAAPAPFLSRFIGSVSAPFLFRVCTVFVFRFCAWRGVRADGPRTPPPSFRHQPRHHSGPRASGWCPHLAGAHLAQNNWSQSDLRTLGGRTRGEGKPPSPPAHGAGPGGPRCYDSYVYLCEEYGL
jgi:hypothetical protein